MGKRYNKEHQNGCGVTLKVGDIIKFKKESLEFTEEVFTASRHEELQADFGTNRSNRSLE
jgi:hypothetical protein